MKQNKRIAAIIPARYKSTRFEGKPLAKIMGQPMIYHVYKSIEGCNLLDEIIVATDDERIEQAVRNFGGTAIMTSENHPTGTDRVAEVAKSLDADFIINVQGDEPLIQADMMEEIVRPLLDDDSINVTNMIGKISGLGDYIDTTVVKTAIDKHGFILYFTRSPIPYPKTRQEYVVNKQIGLYAFRRDFLLKYVDMEQSNLELVEGVEFLRILENGYKIKAVATDYNAVSVDTLSDLIEVEKIMKKRTL